MATIHIQSGKNNIDHSFRNSNIQSVPFKIHADCDAKVKKYFDIYVKTKEGGTLTGSFRGFPLQGKKVEFPEGYVGLVLHESIKPSREKDERKFYIVNNFNEMTFWNWDKVTSDNDSITQALQWIDIAEAGIFLHIGNTGSHLVNQDSAHLGQSGATFKLNIGTSQNV